MEDNKKNKGQRKNVLGRGLSALLSDAPHEEDEQLQTQPTPQAVAPAGIQEVPLAAVEPNPYQPRLHFDPEALQELADSIRAQGIIQPITVRRLGQGSYQLISGERRLQASKLAGLTHIPAYIRTANDEQMLEMALIENIQRADLNPIEVALAYKRLMDECAIVIEEVGEKVGKKRSTVNNYLRLLKLPAEIQAALRDTTLSMGHARALITIENPLTQLDIYRQILARNLSVRQVEELVRQDSASTAVTQPKKNAVGSPTPYTLQLKEMQKALEGKFGTKIIIADADAKGGEIRLKYYSPDDLARLYDLLN